MTKGSFYVRLARNKKVKNFLSGSKIAKKPAVIAVEEPGRIDIFGLLPRDIQIEVLGYVAADRPAQILLMRKVCRRWREILSEDQIYHSALFTASFSLPPPPVSLDAFQDVAWTDDRVRKHRLWKGRVIAYERGKQPENNSAQPSKVIYRDGFIVWWVVAGGYFNYADLNQEKGRKKSYSVSSGYTFGWAPPLYTQAGGKLVFMRPKAVPGVGAGDQGPGEGERNRTFLNVVLLQTPLVKGAVSLSKIEHLSEGPWELYSSRNYALVLRGLELLVVDIRDVLRLRILHIIHLHEKTSLESPFVNTIEISNKDNCLVVLTSRTTGCLETITFSLTSGLLLKRHSTKSPPEGRIQSPQGTRYHIKHSNEFARDTPYQVQNQTHKERPAPSLDIQHRWLYIPTSGDGCITGSYNNTAKPPPQPHTNIPNPLSRHCVTFGRQAVSFTALQDSFTPTNVNRISLQITTGNIGVEQQDTDRSEIYTTSPRHEIGAPTGKTGTSITWSRGARMSAPSDCLIEDGDNVFTDTHRWAYQRRLWGQHSILLGDEKALVLALPHHLMVWRFETPEIWKDRKKRRIKKLASRALMHGVLLPVYAGVVAVMLPFIFVGCAKCAYKACATRYSEERRNALQALPAPEGGDI